MVKVIDNKMIILQKIAGYSLEPVVWLWYTKAKENFMAELIKKDYGRVVSVTPKNPSCVSEEWTWRKAYEGFYGIMHIYQSQHKCPGKYFIVIYDIEFNYLKTGAGDLTEHDGRLTLTTKNSIYTFECMNFKRKDSN